MNPRRTTVTISALVRTEVALTVELSDQAIADIKANRDDFDAPTIIDAKIGPHAGIDLADVRARLTQTDGDALATAVINAVRNGQVGGP